LLYTTQAAAQTFSAADQANEDIDPLIKAVVCCNINCQGAEGTAEERRCGMYVTLLIELLAALQPCVCVKVLCVLHFESL